MPILRPILRPLTSPLTRAMMDWVGGGDGYGPELIVNGTFDSGTAGWAAAGGATIAWNAGEQAASASVTGSGGGITQSVAVEAGVEYLLEMEVWTGTYNGTSFATAASNGLPAATLAIGPNRAKFSIRFVATGTPVVVRFARDTTNTGTVLFDNITLRSAPPLSLLEVPTFDNNPSVSHPDVYDSKTGFAGFRYWMVNTPFPDESREVPQILCSNDGSKFGFPTGAPVPLLTNANFSTALGGDYAYNSDTDIVPLPDGKLAVYSRPVSVVGGLTKEWLIRVVSDDGVAWGDIEILDSSTPGDPITWRSPAIVVDPDDTFHMWTTGEPAGDDVRQLLYRSSADGLAWSAPTVCTTPDNQKIWHLDVARTDDGTYHLLAAVGTTQNLWYWKSTDKTTFVRGLAASTTQAVQPIASVDKVSRYRSTLQKSDDGGWNVWMVSVDNTGSGDVHRIAFLPNHTFGA